MKRGLAVVVPLAAVALLAFVVWRPAESDSPSRVPNRSVAATESGSNPQETSKPAPVPQHRSAGAAPSRSAAMLLGAVDPQRIARFPLPDLLRRVRMLARDVEMTPALRELAESWRASADPSVRLRGEVLRPTLEGSWDEAAQSHPDPEVRMALLESPPDLSSRTLDVLLSAVEREVSGPVRMAAMRGLPVGLDAERVGRLASRIRSEPESAARIEIIELLATFQVAERPTVEALHAVAYSPAASVQERDAAQAALLKCADGHPGLMSKSEREALQRAMLNPATSP